MTGFEKYPEYQVTKYPWIGDLPNSWNVRRLKEVGRLFGGAGFPHEYQNVQGEELYFYKVGDLSLSENGKTLLASPHTISKETARVLRATIVPKSAIVYAKIGAALLLNRRRMTTAACCIDNNMTAYVTEAEEVIPEWAFYWLSTIDFGEHVNPGAVPSFSEGYQSVLPIPVPPVEEQKVIARFLDFKTAQIDALIAKKKSLLDKLAEKRTALISHAVTKGLDPSVPMKDSEVAWLGNIPAHWEAKRTKFTVSYIGSGKTPKGGSEVYVQEGIMILRSQNVHDKGLRLDDVAYITDEADSAQAASRVLAGDVLLNITGASIGRTSIVPTPFPQANVNQHVCILRPVRDLVTSEYLHLLLCSRQAKDQISSLENGTSREGLNFTQVGGLLFAFPPVQEQVAIVLTLASKVEAIDRQSEKVLSVIERLVEYRSSVITNAVTGKIDVRGFPIPQTAEGVAS
jgi:type I restriction enzyme S subunit